MVDIMANKWKLTDSAKAKIPEWNRQWINTIRRTTPMNDTERKQVDDAIRQMYRLAKLDGDNLRVVFVPSPLMAAIVAGAAASWYQSGSDATRDATSAATSIATDAATDAATRDATRDATLDATLDATSAATRDATYNATYNATRNATRAAVSIATANTTDAATRAATDAATFAATRNATDAATFDVTRDATDAATRDATFDATFDATLAATFDVTRDATLAATRDATLAATYNATDAATKDAISSDSVMLSAALSVVGDTPFVRSCIANTYNMRNGGNQWAAWCCFLSFVRDIIGWSDTLHDAYSTYETCAIHSGPRYMHPKFCIISDMPTVLEGYERDGGVIVAHCETGPSHVWADGWALWHIDGVPVDKQIVLHPETQTIEQIDNEQNEEVRRVRIERFGWARYIAESDAECIDSRRNDIDGTTEALVRLKDGSIRMLCTCRSTGRVYAIGVDRETKTCQQAQNWMATGGNVLAGRKSVNIIGAS